MERRSSLVRLGTLQEDDVVPSRGRARSASRGHGAAAVTPPPDQPLLPRSGSRRTGSDPQTGIREARRAIPGRPRAHRLCTVARSMSGREAPRCCRGRMFVLEGATEPRNERSSSCTRRTASRCSRQSASSSPRSCTSSSHVAAGCGRTGTARAGSGDARQRKLRELSSRHPLIGHVRCRRFLPAPSTGRR